MKFPHRFKKEGNEFKDKLYWYAKKIINFCVEQRGNLQSEKNASEN